MTERKETEAYKELLEALRASEERLRITMESAVDFAIITTNTDGIVEGWNTGAERIFGFKAEEIKGKTTDRIFTPEDRAAGVPQKEMQTAVKKGYAEDERWHINKDSTRFFASGVMRPIYNSRLTGFVKVARDVTQQKLLEQQKDDFIGIASHELKTPITSIGIYAEILHENFEASDDKVNGALIQKLNVQVNRLNQLVNDLLDTSRIAGGKMVIYPQQFNLNVLITEKIEDLRQLSRKHTLTFRNTEQINITADRERIGQVLINLLSNAIKYSPGGGEVLVSSEKIDDNVRVSIKDGGIGIAKDIINRIFDRFFRAGGAIMNTYPGMGLGLFISAEIIHQHGGAISVESDEGKGSTFYFTLPIKSNIVTR